MPSPSQLPITRSGADANPSERLKQVLGVRGFAKRLVFGAMNIYETKAVLSQYLLFHYGDAMTVMPYAFGPKDAVGFAVRTIHAGLHRDLLPRQPRALDLGCAVGRSTFELARIGCDAIGIDFSQAFIEAANLILHEGELAYSYQIEGDICRDAVARRPENVDVARVRFEVGDACNLRDDLGTFDIVHMANLIDRLHHPAACLARMKSLVNPGGQLVITSPYSWLEEFTPRQNWLGGYTRDGVEITTLDGLHSALKNDFDLLRTLDVPFLLRLHARRFEWSVAQLTTWRRREKHYDIC